MRFDALPEAGRLRGGARGKYEALCEPLCTPENQGSWFLIMEGRLDLMRAKKSALKSHRTPLPRGRLFDFEVRPLDKQYLPGDPPKHNIKLHAGLFAMYVRDLTAAEQVEVGSLLEKWRQENNYAKKVQRGTAQPEDGAANGTGEERGDEDMDELEPELPAVTGPDTPVHEVYHDLQPVDTGVPEHVQTLINQAVAGPPSLPNVIEAGEDGVVVSEPIPGYDELKPVVEQPSGDEAVEIGIGDVVQLSGEGAVNVTPAVLGNDFSDLIPEGAPSTVMTVQTVSPAAPVPVAQADPASHLAAVQAEIAGRQADQPWTPEQVAANPGAIPPPGTGTDADQSKVSAPVHPSTPRVAGAPVPTPPPAPVPPSAQDNPTIV